MQRRKITKQCNLLALLAGVFGHFFFSLAQTNQGVALVENEDHVVISNGIVSVTLASPEGFVTGICYSGIDNLLEARNGANDRGYWDVNWVKPDSPDDTLDRLEGTRYKLIVHNSNQVEVSFIKTWDASIGDRSVPVTVDKRFVLLGDSPGLYTYAIFERQSGWPGCSIPEARIVFKLQEDKFHYMAVSDQRQKYMPSAEDRTKGQQLDYPEAVLLTDKDEVDDKYLYSCENKDNRVHGWVSTDPPVGFWMITPSNEFRTGGPIKQDLTSHVGPTTLSMFVSTHYAGADLAMYFQNGEPWKKVFGLVFIYLNSDNAAATNPSVLWDNAKQRMSKEVSSWPYTFPNSGEYLKPTQRAAVRGQLVVHDKYTNADRAPASLAYVGLTAQGSPGSWQTESKGYQFWSQADSSGNFLIKDVLPGRYNLYAWVPGYIGDYKYPATVTISPGVCINLKQLVYEPPRSGPTLWEIGVPDRTAAEFYIPDPDPHFKTNSQTEKFRAYGLWNRYTELYPNDDLIFTIGSSDYKTDWFFAHVNRKFEDQIQKTMWKILFDLKDVDSAGTYTLQLALASANMAELQVRFNSPDVEPPHLATGKIGSDNAIARHGIHGLYWLYSLNVPGNILVNGRNTIFLKQYRNDSMFVGVMYDYIRLEGPPN